MRLDRKFQLELLIKLSEAFPSGFDFDDGSDKSDEFKKKYAVNLVYLSEHGLIDVSIRQNLSGSFQFGRPKITAKGLDHLENDGGLSAILGVVVVRLHDETVRNLVEMAIRSSELDQPNKQKLISQLRSLPGDSIKHLVLKLLDMALESGPAAIASIGKYLHP